jgi:hypothetical protein
MAIDFKSVMKEIEMGVFPSCTEKLSLMDERGRTIAFFLVSQGFSRFNKEQLTISNQDGWTVAHALALREHVFYEEDILELDSKYNLTVADVQRLAEHKRDKPMTLALG